MMKTLTSYSQLLIGDNGGYMRILKNNEINNNMIKQMRKTIISDSKEVKQFLGINSSNITSVLPIKNINFNIWFLCEDDDQIIGFLSFDDMDNDVKYIKSFYIVPTFRKHGYGRNFINKLYENYPKLECRINPGNSIMYKLVKSIGMREEKFTNSRRLPLDTEPIWWSNYKTDSI